ncbi:hypothetical protein pdam_00010777 [Pocillopora damicornis]|uniref:Sulfotransferase domain-containing protein n=1 Tax=Pocillopora damicornis TaxID=46731 RepID=A0A3M6UYQ6_POCDA|nr:hypothetical protein pdam_00010777 [Pocillopora damicornis]
MFAEDPQLMTVYEPLWIITKWNKEDSSQIPNWTKNVLDLLRGILSCKFAETAAGVKFLSHTSRKWNGANVKNPFQSQNFCPNWECKKLSRSAKYADTVCLTKYKHSVTKIGETRTPNSSISSFLPKVFLENPDTDIRVIQLIRDPRASFRSRIKLRWMVDWTHRNFRKLVRKVCSNLVANIKFGRNLGKWQDRYLEVHYHDLAGKPLETTRAMYDFAGFEMPDSIADWVVRNTSPSKEELMKESKNIFSPTRNSTANIDKWKQDSPVFLENPDTDIRVIQLIRDPRASLRSRIKLGWMVDWTHSSFPNLVRKICSNLVANIKFGRNLGKWQDKYLEVHYHDLAGKPLETTRAVYNFAGFEMPDSIADWVVRNTSPSKEELMKESKNIFSPTRNSTANIDKWKQDSPVERIQIIEKYCKKALDLLGLKKML